MPWRAGGWVRTAGGGSGRHKGGPGSATGSCLGHGPLCSCQGRILSQALWPLWELPLWRGEGKRVRSRGEGTTSQHSHHGMEAG